MHLAGALDAQRATHAICPPNPPSWVDRWQPAHWQGLATRLQQAEQAPFGVRGQALS